jgi:hypothetical protein
MSNEGELDWYSEIIDEAETGKYICYGGCKSESYAYVRLNGNLPGGTDLCLKCYPQISEKLGRGNSMALLYDTLYGCSVIELFSKYAEKVWSHKISAFQCEKI